MTRKRTQPPKPQPEPNPEDNEGKEVLETDDELIDDELTDDNLIDDSISDDELIVDPLVDDYPGGFPPDDNFSSDNPSVDDTSDINPAKSDVQYEYFKDRSYIFLFGPSSVGKTVIIGSIYEYLNTHRGSLYGDTLSNLNRNEVPYERKGNQLLNQFIQRSHENTFPDSTAVAATESTRIPKHLNFQLLPADRKKPNFEFCFMDMAGEDLAKIDFNSDVPLPDSIRTYIEDVPQKNLCFIYVIDPAEETKSKIEQIQLFNAFINLIDSNDHKKTPILLLVSKWDLVKEYNQVEDYLINEFSQIWGMINQEGRSFDYREFSVGRVIGNTIEEYDYSYPERVFNWVYTNQMGVDLIEQPKEEGWWVRLFKKYL